MEGFKEQARRCAIPAQREQNEDLSIIKKASDKINDTAFDLQYIPVELSTKGRFDCPEKIHIRNFTIEEILEINSASENEKSLFMIRALKKIIKEDVDPALFLETEVNEIILSLLANNYITKLDDLEYYLTKEEEQDLEEKDPSMYAKYIKNKENGIRTFSVNVPISSIRKQYISDDIKPIITLTGKFPNGDFKIQFRHIRVGDVLIINDYIKNKFKEEENRFFLTTARIEKEQLTGDIDVSISIDERNNYERFIKTKATDAIISMVKLLIISINDKKLDSLEEKFNAYIPPVFYEKINDYLSKNTFGLLDEVIIESPYSNKSVTRRFQFRPTELLSQYRLSGDSLEFNFSFG